jgi:hypothetical protein
MIDPTTRKPGRVLQLTVGHMDDVGEQLYAHQDTKRAPCYPVELTGDLYQTRTVLRCLEDALHQQPLNDHFGDEQMNALAEPQARTYAAVNEARRILDTASRTLSPNPRPGQRFGAERRVA